MTPRHNPCVVDFNVDDTAPSIEALLVRIRPCLRAVDTMGFSLPVIDLRLCRYLGPAAAAILGALWHEAQRTDRSLSVVLPSSPPALAAFCGFSGLAAMMGAGTPPESDHPENETVPVTRLTDGPGLESEKLIRLVQRHAALGEDEAEYLRIAFNEVMHNVIDHASSPIGAVYCAKYFSKTGEVRLAVVDRGATIPEVLWRRHPQIAPSPAALRAVIRGGVSSKSRDNNMGLGISNLAAFAQTHAGRLGIVSRDAIAEVRADGRILTRSQVNLWFRGTCVFLSMRVVGTL